jgi:hypothetical protein
MVLFSLFLIRIEIETSREPTALSEYSSGKSSIYLELHPIAQLRRNKPNLASTKSVTLSPPLEPATRLPTSQPPTLPTAKFVMIPPSSSYLHLSFDHALPGLAVNPLLRVLG